MANTIMSSVKCVQLCSKLIKFNKYGISAISSQRIQTLYSSTSLGIDGFVQQQEKTKQMMSNISEKFRLKMTEFTSDDSKNLIFTEDLKNMIHLSESDEDIELVVRMLRRFNQQNEQLRFGSFIFGPVVMRLFYSAGKPDLALECFKSPDFSGIFDQLMTYQILLDLLYESGKYDEMLEAYKLIRERQIEGIRFPKNVIVLTLAACYKLNTPKSLEFAKQVWKEILEAGHVPMRRAVTFFAALAINQKEPALALEVISNTRNQNYTTIRNIKALALTEIGRVEEAVFVLKSILSEDTPDGPRQTFNKDVVESVKKAVEKLENAELLLEFEKIESIFQKEGHISEENLDGQLCKQIEGVGSFNKSQQQRPFDRQRQTNRNYDNERRFTQRPRQQYQRPGLSDLN